MQTKLENYKNATVLDDEDLKPVPGIKERPRYFQLLNVCKYFLKMCKQSYSWNRHWIILFKYQKNLKVQMLFNYYYH